VLINLARPCSYVFEHAIRRYSAVSRSLKCATQTTLEQNMNTAMMTAGSAHDDLGGMIPENIPALVWRLWGE